MQLLLIAQTERIRAINLGEFIWQVLLEET